MRKTKPSIKTTATTQWRECAYLENRFEEPNEEGLDRQRATFLQRSVEGRVLHDDFDTDVLVEN